MLFWDGNTFLLKSVLAPFLETFTGTGENVSLSVLPDAHEVVVHGNELFPFHSVCMH